MSGDARGQRRRARSVPDEDDIETQHPLQAPHGKAPSKNYKSPSYASSLASLRDTSDELDDDLASRAGLTDDEETGLTKDQQKERRRRRRRQAYQAPDEGVGVQGKKGWLSMADMVVLKKSGVNAMLIGLWYLFSVSISVVCSSALLLPRCKKCLV